VVIDSGEEFDLLSSGSLDGGVVEDKHGFTVLFVRESSIAMALMANWSKNRRQLKWLDARKSYTASLPMPQRGLLTTARKMFCPKNGNETRVMSKVPGETPFVFDIP